MMNIGNFFLWQAADGYKTGENADDPNDISATYMDDYVVIETKWFVFSQDEFDEFVSMVRAGFRMNDDKYRR